MSTPAPSDLAASGKTNREIAEALWVTRKTVEVHLGKAYGKLGVRRRVELPVALERPPPGNDAGRRAGRPAKTKAAGATTLKATFIKAGQGSLAHSKQAKFTILTTFRPTGGGPTIKQLALVTIKR